MTRRPREFWESIVEAYSTSQEPIAVFARRHQVHVGTLRWWASRLRCERRRAMPVRVLPVERAVSCAAPQRTTERLDIVLDGIMVHVAVGTDSVYVGRLVREIRSGC
jgi:transposase-like protein